MSKADILDYHINSMIENSNSYESSNYILFHRKRYAYKSTTKNYFNYHLEKIQIIYKQLNRFMPVNFKDGITIIGKKR